MTVTVMTLMGGTPMPPGGIVVSYGEVGTFLGPATAVDARVIDATYCVDVNNFQLGDGSLKPRYGFTARRAAPAGFSAVYGFMYFDAFTSAGVEKEEHISIETRTGATHFWSGDTATGAATEIKNGAASFAADPSEWKGFAFLDTAYLINKNQANGSVIRHKIADPTSLVQILQPAAPPVPGWSFNTTLRTLNYTGGGGYASGAAAGSIITVATAQQVQFSLPGGAIGDGVIGIDLNGSVSGITDCTYEDVARLALQIPNSVFLIEIIGVDLINNDGAPLTMPASMVDVEVVAGGGQMFTLNLYWDGKTRADFDNIRKINVRFTVVQSGGSGNNVIRIQACSLRGIDTAYGHDLSETVITFGVTNYNSTGGFESAMSTVDIPRERFGSRRSMADGVSYNPGSQQYLVLTASGDANVDKNRIYMKCSDGRWHRIGEQAKATATFTIRLGDIEGLLDPLQIPFAFTITGCVCGCRFSSWAVYGYSDGTLRHSRDGDPDKQAADTDLDPDEDPTVGFDFTLPEDRPYDLIAVGQTLFITGAKGIYVQVPFGALQPSNMRPPHRIPGAIGAAGPSAAVAWFDDYGRAALVYMDYLGEMRVIPANQLFEGDTAMPPAEFTPMARGFLKKKLLTDQGLTILSSVRVATDEAGDTLSVALGTVECVLSKPSVYDGKRQWQPYSYTMPVNGAITGAIGYLSFSLKRRKRWIRATGQIDDVEINSNTGAFITGATMDDGQAPPAASFYWQSKIFNSFNRRVDRIHLVRDTYADTPTVQIISSFLTDTRAFVAGERYLRFGPRQTGFEHQFKVIGGPTLGAIRKMIVRQNGPIGGRKAN